MTSKLTIEQQQQSWYNLQQKIGNYTPFVNRKKMSKYTQRQKNTLIEQAIEEENEEDFSSALKIGGVVSLEKLLYGSDRMFELGLLHQFPIKNLNQLWNGAFNSTKAKLTLLLDSNTPYDNKITMLAWGQNEVQGCECQDSIKLWHKAGKSLIPENLTRQGVQKFQEVFSDMLALFILEESPQELYTLLDAVKESIKKEGVNPFEGISLTENAKRVWSQLFTSNNKLEKIQILLEFGIFPPPTTHRNQSWAMDAFSKHQVELFEFFIQDDLQKNLFEQDMKEDGLRVMHYHNPILDSKRIELISKLDIPFEKKDKNKNSVFHQIFYYINIHSDSAFYLSKEALNFLGQHCDFIWTQKNKDGHTSWEMGGGDIKIKTDKGVINSEQFRAFLEKEKLSQSIAKSVKPFTPPKRL